MSNGERKKCAKCGCEWKARHSDGEKDDGCPCCARSVVTNRNSLAVTHPELAKGYSEKNPLPADKIVAQGARKLWWLCKNCGYEWEATAENRLRGHSCPRDAVKIVSLVDHPELREEYSDENPVPFDEADVHGGKNFWWKCRTCGHSWRATIKARLDGHGCRKCRGKKS